MSLCFHTKFYCVSILYCDVKLFFFIATHFPDPFLQIRFVVKNAAAAAIRAVLTQPLRDAAAQ